MHSWGSVVSDAAFFWDSGLKFLLPEDRAGASGLVCEAMVLFSMECCPIQEFLRFTLGADKAMD